MNAVAGLECGDASRRFHVRRRKSPRLAPRRGKRRLASPHSRAALLILLLSTQPLFAATPTSAITGRVISSGAPAAGVTVTVTGTAIQGERTTVTTSTGRYWLTGVPPGRHDVTFSRPGLQTLTRRVLIELARVSRADATLEPSDDEESITSTAIPIGVAQTTAITTHFSDETFERLPMDRSIVDALFLAPGQLTYLGFLNSAPSFGATVLSGESLEQLTILRAAVPADVDAYATPVYFGRTRSGGEDFSFSIRDTITNFSWHDLPDFPGAEDLDNGLEQLIEATAGGRIVPDRLWFFAGAWHGSQLFSGDRKGFDAKLTWNPGAQHNLTAFYAGGELRDEDFHPDASIASLQYIGMPSPRFTAEAVVSRASTGTELPGVPESRFAYDYDSLFAKASYVLGDHVLSAGGRAAEDNYDNATTFFVNDRFTIHRLTVNAGARHEFDRISPRVAAAFDVRGNGRQAISASVSDYADAARFLREVTLGFATAIGQTGSLRVDGLRRDHGPANANGLQGDFRYTLFDRFHTGGSYTYYDFDPSPMFALYAEHAAHVWAGVDLPAGEHEFGVTAMQHYTRVNEDRVSAIRRTDLALRYSLPVRQVHLTVAADVTNVFDQTNDTFVAGRAYRGWVRLRH